ncbi:MAG: hypothetical protein FWG65_10865 [Turicibacter sp.]|nr:hypothetical protein [Turicibacter sp.]
MPETEWLYINVGGREGAFDVEYTWHRRLYRFGVWWIESDYCKLICDGTINACYEDCPPTGGQYDCTIDEYDEDGSVIGSTEAGPQFVVAYNNRFMDPGENAQPPYWGTDHTDVGRTWVHSFPSAQRVSPGESHRYEEVEHYGDGVYQRNMLYALTEFRFLQIQWAQVRAASEARVFNPELYQDNAPIIDQTPIRYNHRTNFLSENVGPGTRDDWHYGTDGNLSMFSYPWHAAVADLDTVSDGSTEAAYPNERCFSKPIDKLNQV